MKKLLILLLLIPALSFSFGQNALTYGGKALTYDSKVLTVEVAAYSTEYQAIYDAYTTKPSDATAVLQNALVEGWIADGDWTTKDVIYVYATHTNGDGEALINWKLPGTYDATAYNAPTFTANEGFTGNGTTQYIDCNWNPSTNGINYVQNSASQIIYIRTDVISGANISHGTYGNVDNKNCNIFPRYSGDVAYITTNDNTPVNDVNADGSGMFMNTRIAVAVNKLYRNKVAIVEATTTSTGVPTHNPYCLAYNDDDVASGHRVDQVSMYAFGSGMTQTNVNNFTDRFETYMDALGKGVIP